MQAGKNNYEDKCCRQTLNLDNKCSGSFYGCRELNNGMYGHKASGTLKVMWGELRGEISACKRACGRALEQVEQGIVIEEGKI